MYIVHSDGKIFKKEFKRNYDEYSRLVEEIFLVELVGFCLSSVIKKKLDSLIRYEKMFYKYSMNDGPFQGLQW